MRQRWQCGDVVVRREVLGLGASTRSGSTPTSGAEQVWFGLPVYIVEDTDEALVSFIGPEAEFGFVEGYWPTPTGVHPWSGRTGWVGPGCLMVQQPGEDHAVWHFWDEADGSFRCWYINFQAPFRRTAIGYDTQDLELDIVVHPDGRWVLKDLDVLGDRVSAGQLTQEVVDHVVRLSDDMAIELDAGRHWWDPRWADWSPPATWRHATLPPAWT